MWRKVETLTIYAVIIGALGAGLAASYGRELEAKRQPDRHWVLRRLLIMPLLAIAATAAADAFQLSASFAGFAAAMLSLGGYDALRLIESKWLKRVGHTAIPEEGKSGEPQAEPAEQEK